MITAPNTSATGAYFTKAPNGSAFRKVFLNNMDENSFRTTSDHSDTLDSAALSLHWRSVLCGAVTHYY